MNEAKLIRAISTNEGTEGADSKMKPKTIEALSEVAQCLGAESITICDHDEEVLDDIDTVITELKVEDSLQAEWAEAIRVHAAASGNALAFDRFLYVTGYTLLARARLLGGIGTSLIEVNRK